VRVVKSSAGMFRDKLKERFPPRSIRIIKHLFAKLLQFFNADDSNGFRDRFAPFAVDGCSVLEFFKWHKTPLDLRESELSALYSSPGNRAKENDPFGPSQSKNALVGCRNSKPMRADDCQTEDRRLYFQRRAPVDMDK